MAHLVLPQAAATAAGGGGGRPCYAALLDVANGGDVPLRLELRAGEAEAWEVVLPCVPPGQSWAAATGRRTPLWLWRTAQVRLVRASDGRVVLLRCPWGDGGVLVYEPV
jgi:hypothetical protein